MKSNKIFIYRNFHITTRDMKRPKGISQAIGKNTHAHGQLYLRVIGCEPHSATRVERNEGNKIAR